MVTNATHAFWCLLLCAQKIRLKHLLHFSWGSALPVPYVVVRVTRRALVYLYLCASSLENLSVQHGYYPLSVYLWKDLAHPVFDGVGQWVSRAKAAKPKLHYPFLSSTIFLFLIFLSIGRYCGAGAGPMFFIGISCSLPLCLLLLPFLLFLSIGWYCGAGVFGLILCK